MKPLMANKIQEVLQDHSKFISSFLKIETKDQRVVQFIPNRTQRYLEKIFTKRDVILKARQLGVSAWVLGKMLAKVLCEGNCNCVLISHEKGATQRLLRRVKFYIENLPMKIQLNHESANELTFPKTNSEIYIGTAGQRSFGRGDTIHFLHCSEIAQWPRPAETLSSALNCVDKNGQIVIESTAQGIGTWFYKFWKRAKIKGSAWNPVFIPWFEDLDYSLEGPPLGELTSEEKHLKKKFKLSDNQLRWRRWKISEMDDEILFRQEFPATDNEAFVSKKGCVFEKKILRSLLERSQKPRMVASLDDEDSGLTEDENGLLKVWKHPVRGRDYVIGADVGAGVEKGDPSCAIVFDPIEQEQVAEFHALMPPDLYAWELVKLGTYYNLALLAVERNNPGLVTVIKLYELAYMNLLKEKKIDKPNNNRTEKIGLYTTGKLKEVMILNFKKLMRKGLRLWSEDLINECDSFVYKDSVMNPDNPNSKRMEAESGAHDDRVMAGAIGAYCMSGDEKEEPKPDEIMPLRSLEWYLQKEKARGIYKWKIGNW